MNEIHVAHYSTQSWPISRQFERAKLEVPVEVESGGQRYRGWLVDIGEGGFAMTVPAPLGKGAEITALIALSDTCTIKVRAVVRHGNGFRFGCEFLLVSSEDRRVIRDQVSQASRPRRRFIA
jgi:PilZ domain